MVVLQVQGLWKTKTPNMVDLCKVAKELKDRFMSFEIRHVERVHLDYSLNCRSFPPVLLQFSAVGFCKSHLYPLRFVLRVLQVSWVYYVIYAFVLDT